MKLSSKLITTLALTAGISMAHAGAVVVAGASSPLAAASSGDVVKVFLGKKKALGGVSVVPVDQSEGAGARTDFYSNVVKKSEAQLKSYWSRLIFTGKGQAPQVVGGDADVKGMVASNPNLLGYIDEGAVDGTVKVIFKP
jgi:ABC-type phosphate transport system substrate-binding protein